MKPRSGRSEFYAPLSPPVFTSQYHAVGALSDETDATVQQYQEYFVNLYDLGFRLVSIGP